MAGVADLGGSIITGIDGNPLAVLAAQLRVPLHHINSKDVPLFCDDGTQADRTLDGKVSPRGSVLIQLGCSGLQMGSCCTTLSKQVDCCWSSA